MNKHKISRAHLVRPIPLCCGGLYQSDGWVGVCGGGQLSTVVVGIVESCGTACDVSACANASSFSINASSFINVQTQTKGSLYINSLSFGVSFFFSLHII